MNGPTVMPDAINTLDDAAAAGAIPDTFRHVAFLAALLLILGAWKFGLEGILE